jgi:hypothetical protein
MLNRPDNKISLGLIIVKHFSFHLFFEAQKGYNDNTATNGFALASTTLKNLKILNRYNGFRFFLTHDGFIQQLNG